jgi:hypothetical protein
LSKIDQQENKTEVPDFLQNFNEGKISDDEDNSWADGLSESDEAPEEVAAEASQNYEEEDDDYYGE